MREPSLEKWNTTTQVHAWGWNNRRCWLMLHFLFSPESLYANVRFCNAVQCGYSKAVWGLATKACPHHKQKRCWSPRVKFPSGVLQTEEHLDWITASVTERNERDVINCNYLLRTEWRKRHMHSEILLLSSLVLHCLTNLGSSPDLQPG